MLDANGVYAPPKRDLRADALAEMARVCRRSESWEGTFSFEPAGRRESAVEELRTLGAHVNVPRYGNSEASVSFDAQDAERMLDAIVARGGRFVYAGYSSSYNAGPTDDPLSSERRYEAPDGFRARLAAIEKLRTHLSNTKLDLDYWHTPDDKWCLRIGTLTITLDETQRARWEQLGVVDELELHHRLTDRLLDLLG